MQYLSWLYWFNSRPEPLSKQGINILLLVVVVLLIIVLAQYLGFFYRLKISRKLIHKITTFCFTNALIGIFVAFLNYELIPYLRARVIYIIWGVIVLVWIWKLLPLKKRQTETTNSSREQEIKKYLPN
jgi:hypothetical protein